jgi:hypothetical protein
LKYALALVDDLDDAQKERACAERRVEHLDEGLFGVDALGHLELLGLGEVSPRGCVRKAQSQTEVVLQRGGTVQGDAKSPKNR